MLKAVGNYVLDLFEDCAAFNFLAKLLTKYPEYGSFLLARSALRSKISPMFHRLRGAKIAS